MTYHPREIAKALAALLTSLGTWGYTAASDGTIDPAEWFGICGVLVAGLAVFAYPNTPPAGEPGDPEVSEQHPRPTHSTGDRGHVGPTETVLILLLIALVVVLVL